MWTKVSSIRRWWIQEMLWRTNQEVLLKYYITDRRNEERKKTKQEEKEMNERTKDSKIHAITKKKRCNERDANKKTHKQTNKLKGSKIIKRENGYYGIKCRKVKLGIHFDRMTQTKHFLIPIFNNCIQFKIDKSYGNGKEIISPYIVARTLLDTILRQGGVQTKYLTQYTRKFS